MKCCISTLNSEILKYIMKNFVEILLQRRKFYGKVFQTGSPNKKKFIVAKKEKLFYNFFSLFIALYLTESKIYEIYIYICIYIYIYIYIDIYIHRYI